MHPGMIKTTNTNGTRRKCEEEEIKLQSILGHVISAFLYGVCVLCFQVLFVRHRKKKNVIKMWQYFCFSSVCCCFVVVATIDCRSRFIRLVIFFLLLFRISSRYIPFDMHAFRVWLQLLFDFEFIFIITTIRTCSVSLSSKWNMQST